MVNLSTSYLGLRLKNPVLAGSSGLTDAITGIRQLEDYGVGAVVLKSLFEEEILLDLQANMSRIRSELFTYPETLDFYENNDQLREKTEQYLELIRDSKKAVQIPVIASINCISAGQWTYFPRLIQEAGADALELNLFMLPSDFNQKEGDTEKLYGDIIHEVRKQISIPLSLKVSSYFSNLGAFLKKVSEQDIQGLVLFNRYYSPDIDIEKLEVTSAGVFSHPEDIYTSLRWIAIMAGRVDCDLAASTGIHDTDAVIKQLLAGAQVVQLATALYRKGPEFVPKLLKELESWMSRKGYSSPDDFRGMLSQARSNNPASFERVQFIKYFRGYHPESLPPDFI